MRGTALPLGELDQACKWEIHNVEGKTGAT